MSEPKRYIFRIRECGCVKPEHLEGKYAPSALIIEETEEKCGWVGYEDYARLKAEVERLTKVLGMCESIDSAIDVWIESKANAAKEGKGQP